MRRAAAAAGGCLAHHRPVHGDHLPSREGFGSGIGRRALDVERLALRFGKYSEPLSLCFLLFLVSLVVAMVGDVVYY